MKKTIFVLSLLLGLIISSTVSAHTAAEPFETSLIADQNIEVGKVQVWNDSDNLYVEYITEGGWELVETHLYVGKTDPVNLTSAPGQFPYSSDNPYVIPLEDICEYKMELNKKGKETGKMVVVDGTCGGLLCEDDVYIAAHAVVEKTECQISEEAPYGALSIFNYNQSLRKDGTPVREGRSDPDAVLTWDTNRVETDFFSLGFGGWVIAEFDCCIANGEGSDVLIVEDTWGTYPLESAEVYASNDGVNWTLLGTANNVTRDTTYNWQTVSEFDLGGLECAKYIKVLDTTPIGPMPADGDGFDLNTIQSLQDCEECTTYNETAWGGGTDFDQNNWSMYFTYTIQCPPEIIRWPEEGTAYIGYEDWTNGDFDYNDFGMTMAVEEWYEDDVLTDIYLTFEAVIYDSGADHYINILRSGLVGDYEYEVARSGAAYAGEKAAGNYPGSGDFDVVLFNTSKYGWPSKQIGETVEIHIYNFETENSQPLGLTPPRSYNTGGDDFYDLDPLFAIYDPWMDPFSPGWIDPYEWHIGDTQVISSTSNQKHYPAGEVIPVGTETPMILAVPETGWVPPYEDTTITGPYGLFNDFYTTRIPANWYETVTNSAVGYGGFSW